jgi:3-phenylpropionate/trans-cinnamate dioxygenase ferredoxin component
MPWIDACSTEDIDAEDVIRFNHGERTFAIYRNHANQYFCADGAQFQDSGG